jgi:predicted outer membrane repeat protein
LERRCVPATITPTTFADGGLGSGSLRDAVLQFNADTGTADDTIQLVPGTYSLTIRNTHGHENGALEGDLNLTQASHRWIIQGAGPSTIIDANQLQDRVFQIVNPGMQVVFQDLVIQGGLAQDNGADGAQAGTTDALGGGILNTGGLVTVDNVVIQNNVARGGDAPALRANGHNASGGAIYSTGGTLTIAGAAVANNLAIGGRGGDGTGHDAGGGGTASGGGLYATAGSLDISAGTITTNRATGGRGGDNGAITSTSPAGGGGQALGAGLYVGGSALTISTSDIASNQATGGPAGLYGYSGFAFGGGLDNTGTLTVNNSTLSDNSATYYGGGIYSLGTLTVSNSTLSGNSAGIGGGGIYNTYNYLNTLTVSNSTLSGNSASEGAGILNFFGTLTVSNSTLSGNSAGMYSSGGGGIYNYRGTVTVSNSTLSGNSGFGGGIRNEGVLNARNTIIAGNTGLTAPDISGDVHPSGAYNLIGDGTGMSGLTNGVNGNQIGSASAPIDPLLDALGDYGGPTKTHALLPGSPALNTGDPTQLGVPDQRGVIRSGRVNIGAYQASATAFVLTAPDTVTSGVSFDVTVTAVDTFGQVAVGYIGTVTFSTSDTDPGVVLPADYTFTAADGGVHTFTDTGLGEITLVTPGDQTLTVADTTDDTINGNATITVTSGNALWRYARSWSLDLDSYSEGSLFRRDRYAAKAF